jgi:TetR/AcrR family transcriptional repressor of cmeABC operon
MNEQNRSCKRFLEAALDIFLEQGLEKTTMGDILKRSGGSFATLYKYCGSKEKLIETALRGFSEEIFKSFETLAKNGKNLGVEQFLEDFGLRLIEITLSDRSAFLMRTMMSEGHKNGGRLGRIFMEGGVKGCISVLADYIATKQQEGVFRACDPLWAAKHFFLMVKEPYHFSFIMTGEKPQLSQEDKLKIVREATQFFLRGIAATPSAPSPQ